MSTSSPEAVADDFEALLARGAASAAAMAAALDCERRALESEDLTALADAATSKQAHLGDIEALESQRRGLLSRCSLADDHEGMQAFIDRCGRSDELRRKWQRYLTLADDCRRANLTNGAIIRLRHQQLAGALSALSGAPAATYGPDGGEPPTSSRRLAEA